MNALKNNNEGSYHKNNNNSFNAISNTLLMKFKVHYSLEEYDDFFIIEGDELEEIKEKVFKELFVRGVDTEKNNVWSEEL